MFKLVVIRTQNLFVHKVVITARSVGCVDCFRVWLRDLHPCRCCMDGC
jgi:hypothetical protein